MFSFLKADGKNGGGKIFWILLAAALGIALLLFGSTSGKDTEEEAPKEYRAEEDELLIYQNYLEERIRVLCETVGGVRNVTVAVTLSGSFEAVYATEWKNGNEEYVILGSGSSASALYLSRATPEIAGIGIVCEGGSSERIRCELIALLGATFNVSTHRIYVTSK